MASIRRFLAVLGGFVLLSTTAYAQIVINELRTDQHLIDVDEYVEIAGPPGTDISDLTYIVLGDSGPPTFDGIIENVTPLPAGAVIPPDGYYLISENTLTLGGGAASADLVVSLNFENDDNVTHLLVRDFTGMNGDDLDTNDDGVLDSTPWSEIVDSISFVAELPVPGCDQDQFYSPNVILDDPFVPVAAGRCPDQTGDFFLGSFALNGVPPLSDTPGEPNDAFCSECDKPIIIRCSSDCLTGEVTIEWDAPPGNFDGYEVIRNDGFGDVTLAMLPGTDSMFVDTAPVAGNVTYTVLPTCPGGANPSTPPTCTIQADLYNGEKNIVVRLEEDGGAIDSAQAFLDAFALFPIAGEDAVLFSSINPCLLNLGTDIRVWVCKGTFPNDGIITQEDGQILHDLVMNGVPVYLESPDTWVFDFPTPFSDVDGVDASLSFPCDFGNNTVIAGDTLTSVDGAAFVPNVMGAPGVDLTQFQDVTYNQDNVMDDEATATLMPAMTDVLGTEVGPIMVNNPDMNPGGPFMETPYNVMLFYETETGGPVNPGNVISSSMEFGGFAGDQIELVGLLVAGLDGAPNMTTGPLFRRGDSNGDGAFNIADAVFSLNELFVPGSPESSCKDASDSNDDGTFNIADAVFALNELFVPGSPTAPAPGSADCGEDPTMDTLDCPMDQPNCP